MSPTAPPWPPATDPTPDEWVDWFNGNDERGQRNADSEHLRILPSPAKSSNTPRTQQARSMSAELLRQASYEARLASFNGANRFMDALADWWRAEAESHFHIGDDGDSSVRVYDLPGMEQTPAIRAAKAFLTGER